MPIPFKMLRILFGLTLLFVATSPAQANLTVSGGARLLIRNGAVANLNCGDITVDSGSALDLGDGRIENCRNFTLESGAAFDDGTGKLYLNGTWSNDGRYRNSSPNQIRFAGTCGQANSVVGDGDADGDGRSDGIEGIADTDRNGIPEFLDTNAAPTISPIAAQTGPEDQAVGPIEFIISDADRPASALSLRGRSSNQRLISNENISFGGSDARRTITLQPGAEMSGETMITVIVSDRWRSATQSFRVIITEEDDTPVIVGQENLHTFETSPLTVNLADLIVEDPDSDFPDDFSLSVGDGENYTRDDATITATADFSGPLSVTVTVSDGSSQSDAFALQVYVATRKAVTTTDDGGPGSLRQLIADAGPGDLFDLSDLSGTMVLTQGPLNLDQDMTLIGPATDSLVIDGNDAGGVLSISGDAAVVIDRIGITGGITQSYGGAIHNRGDLTLRDVAIFDNIADHVLPIGGDGGGIYNEGHLTLINSTVSANAASVRGGGIYNAPSGTLFVTHCTLTNNAAAFEGGNLFNTGILHMVNTIVGGSIAGGEWADSGTIATNTGNLVEDGSHGSRFSGDPLLGPLQDNGGPTVSHLPQTGSPALDAISPADGPLSDDQRGFSRMENTGDAEDIGAVEVRYFQLTVQPMGDGTGTISVDDAVCDAICTIALPEGCPVTLSAVADDGFAFTGWSHTACGDAETCTVTLAADTTIQAGFGDTDSDGDGLSDAMEITGGTDPHNVDTDGDALADGTEDANRNGVLDAGETDPRHPNPGPGIPILIAPEDESMDIETMAWMQVEYASADSARFNNQTRWQIGRDDAFETLVMDFTSADHLLQATVPRQVLDGNGVYYWRVRFIDSDGLERMWSTVNRFTTRESAVDDLNANHIPDHQEPPAGFDPFIRPPAEDGWQSDLHYLDILADDGTPVQVAMKIDTNVTAMDFFGHAPSTELGSAQACPDDLAMGLFSIRLQTVTAGNARVRLYFSRPLDENTIWYKNDTINGWQDYSGFVTFSDDHTAVTIDLVDGGFGDADGVANGTIVDPSGPAVQTTDSGGGTTGGGGGGGCFIQSLFPDPGSF